jgi:hypothetical protein
MRMFMNEIQMNMWSEVQKTIACTDGYKKLTLSTF